MKKHKVLGLFCIFSTIITLGACSSSPKKMTDYYHDYYTHWAYDENADEMDKNEHTIDENHVCSVCGFVDPIFEIDEDGVLVNLTKHGRTLSKLSIPNNVAYISNEAFSNSKAKSIYLPATVVGVGKIAYNYILGLDHSFEGGVEYVEEEDGYFQSSLFAESNACLIGNKAYASLDEALDAVTYNNTKIYLLKDEHVISKKHDVALETRITRFPIKLIFGASIKGDLNVSYSGILKFGSKITYTGNINLRIRQVHSFYSSGAVAFQELESAPKDVTVRYIDGFITTNDKIVRGGRQTVNTLLIFPVDYYAYGVSEFNKEFDMVTGLSEFGATCTNLTLTAPIEGVNAIIQYQGLTQEYRKYLKIFAEIINVTVFVVDGIFQNLTIENGITRVQEGAFKSFMSTNFTAGVTKLCYLLFSHIRSVTFGRDCQYVENDAFGWNKKLTSVNGGESLIQLNNCAFRECSGLKSVNLMSASQLTLIDLSFAGCSSLCRFILPPSNGWSFNDKTYMYEDLDPENVAKMVLANKYVIRKNNLTGYCSYALYNPKKVDEFGMPNEVRMYNTLDEALSNANDNDIIRLLNPSGSLDDCTFSITKKVVIDATKTINYPMDLRCNFKVYGDAHVQFTKKINFQGNIIRYS